MKPAAVPLHANPLLWRGDQLACIERTRPSGDAALDRELPGGGWPQGTLTEFLLDQEGIGELRLLAPVLAHLAQSGEMLALVAPPYVPYAPAFAQVGIAPSRLLVIAPHTEKERWWAAEQVLRANCTGALLFWPRAVNDQRQRRLQVAAQETTSLAFVFADRHWRVQTSPATLRLELSRAGSRLCVRIRKRRGSLLETPLLLDVEGRRRVPALPSLPPVEWSPSRRVAVARSAVHFNKRYPVGPCEARVWNHALARADQVLRVPAHDPRTHKPARLNRIDV